MTINRPDVGKLLKEAMQNKPEAIAEAFWNNAAGVTYGSAIAGTQSYSANALVNH